MKGIVKNWKLVCTEYFKFLCASKWNLFLKLQFYSDNIASKYHHHQQQQHHHYHHQQGFGHPGLL